MVGQTQNPPGILKKKMALGDITNRAPKGSLGKDKQGSSDIVKKTPAPKVFIFEDKTEPEPAKSEPKPTTPTTEEPSSTPEDPSLRAIGCGSEGGISTVTLVQEEAAVDDVQLDEVLFPDAAPTSSNGEKVTVKPLLFGKGDAVFYADESGEKIKARVIGIGGNAYIVMLSESNKFLCNTKEELLSSREDDASDKHPYWDSIDARKLFRPTKTETVREAIDNQIAILDGALKSCDGWKAVVNGGEFNTNLFNTVDVERVRNRALYMSASLKKVQRKLPWFSWTDCCKEAIEDLEAEGVTYYKSANHVTALYRHFRVQRLVQCPKHVERHFEDGLHDLNKQIFMDESD